jgi:hypothetical protein
MVVVDVVLVAADFVVVAVDFMLDVAAVAAEAVVAAVAAAAWAFSLAAVPLVGAVVSEAAARRGASAAFADSRRGLLGKALRPNNSRQAELLPSSNAIHTKPLRRSIRNTEYRHYRLKIREGFPVVGAAIVGDRVRNTRSALDLLAPCSLVRDRGTASEATLISDQFMLALVQHAHDSHA